MQLPPQNPIFSFPFRARRGFALVIVLAFVVLLVGVCLAFFSNSILQAQISDSSATQVRTSLLADGAVDIITSELKAEIANPANSVDVTGQLSTPPGDGSRVYLPARATAADPATTLVPALQGVTHSLDPSAPNGLENLVKISSDGAPFYPGGPSARASSLSSGNPSQSHPISAAKWNRPLFLEGNSDTDDTPMAPFPVPHWIYVSTDSSDPNPKAPSQKTIGRYAYAIYNEGGLLDINAAGFPLTGGPADAMGAYRTNMSFVDLTKLKGGSDSKYSNTALFDAPAANSIVGWRNYVSAQASGSGLGGYSFSSGEGTAITPSPYFKVMASSPKGFLHNANTALANGVSDRTFVSRNQFIDFLKALGQQSGGTDRLLAGAQYLTTFSRALEQPSFSFPGSFDGVNGAGIPSAPSFYPFGGGGNDHVTKFKQVNSSFLKVRAAANVQRFDGTTAVSGEPLVKKRFPLARLAWLTYEGPSAGRNGADIDRLKELGISSEYLSQGTAANIQAAFGLTWDDTTKRWTYLASRLNSARHICALSEIVGREPNFFELLKASINVDSLAKPAGNPARPPNGGDYQSKGTDKFVDDTKPFYFEQNRIDASVDLAILQMGANIIDQADVDGWPTQIEIPAGSQIFPTLPANNDINAKGKDAYSLSYRYPSNDATGVPVNNDPYVVTGIENLPYIFRVRWAAVRLVDPREDVAAKKVTETGLAAVMLWPELWNPHAYDASATGGNEDYVLGYPRPEKFELTARDMFGWRAQAVSMYNGRFSLAEMDNTAASWAKPWGFHPNRPEVADTDIFSPLTEANSRMTFLITKNDYALFREPTLLNQVGNLPADSALSCAFLSNSNLLGKLAGTGLVTGLGIHSSKSSTRFNGSDFIGFYLGACPGKWNSKNGPTTATAIQFNNFYRSDVSVHSYPGWVFTLKGSDPTGARNVRYDVKRVTNNQDIPLGFPDEFFGKGSATVAPNVDVVMAAGAPSSIGYLPSVYFMTIDPRTSRWNFLDILTDGSTNSQLPPGNGGWETVGSVSPTYRSDAGAGTTLITQKYAQWNSSGLTGWPANIFQSTSGWVAPNPIQLGYFSENKSGSPARYADADKIVRRASGGYSSGTTGLPLAKSTGSTPSDSRPIILNRPFRSVAELGVVFSGTPWKNLNFSFAESGDSALLDTFCVSEVSDPNGLVAGKFDLNTSQVPVVKAILEGAYQNELAAATRFEGNSDKISETTAEQVAQKLVARTNSASAKYGPVTNISNLVGYYIGGGTDKTAYGGFGADIEDLVTPSTPKWAISRYNESAVRALSTTGQARIWNLMIDVIAQTGTFPRRATDLAKFAVAGEKRYWVHLAIDRFTGKVLDRQVEAVNE